MLIKYQALTAQLQKNIKAIYVLVGLDHYLLNDAALSIKKSWRQRGETDEKIISINAAADWQLLLDEANSYSLFAELNCLDLRFEKKALDHAGKEVLGQYLQNVNSRCLIILQAPAVPAKQWQWLANNEHVIVVHIAPLTDSALQSWISTQLKHRGIRYVAKVPALIHQYSQGNMLACAQVIEKLSLIFDNTAELTLEDVQAQLTDQCDFQLYELTDACLTANAGKALHLLRQACNHRVEPTLILWLLSQEIRQLIELSTLLKQSKTFSVACAQLKIWPKRTRFYEITLSHLSLTKLYQLLHDSKKLDENIKTSQNHQVWQGLEKLALSICLGTKK